MSVIANISRYPQAISHRVADLPAANTEAGNVS
jgi:hypothetical protein